MHCYRQAQAGAQSDATTFFHEAGQICVGKMAARYSIPVRVGAPVVAETPVECESAVENLLKQDRIRRKMTGRSCTILGLDTEWDQDGKVALIQLATFDMCVIIQVHMFAGLLRPKLQEEATATCPLLRKLLWEQDIVKVGSAIATDLLMLRTELGLASRSFVDLQTIVR